MTLAQALEVAIIGARATDKPSEARALAATPAPASTRDQYVESLKDFALSMGKQQVLKLLLAQLPAKITTGFIGSLFNPLLGFIVGKALEIAIRETEIGMFFLYIDLRTSAQGRAFYDAAQKNLDKQRGASTPEEKAKAEKELIDAFRSFVRLTN